MSRLNDLFIETITKEFSDVDFEKLYTSVVENKSYDKSALRRYCILGVYICDEKKMGSSIPILSHYITLLTDEKYNLILEEILRILVVLNSINRPTTAINRLYI